MINIEAAKSMVHEDDEKAIDRIYKSIGSCDKCKLYTMCVIRLHMKDPKYCSDFKKRERV